MGRLRSPTGTKHRPTLVAAAASSHDVVSTDELLASGLTRKEIHHLHAIGFLHPRHRGVWAVGRPAVSFAGACRAAVLACGEGSAISHVTGAAVHEFRRSAGRIHVSGPRSLEGHPGLIVHRPRSLPLDEIVDRDGIAVTSVARTILDMAPRTSVETVGKWIHEAGVQRVFDQREALAVLERHPHHRGSRVFAAALTVEIAPTRSGLEDAFLDVVRRAGLPAPLVNSHQWTSAGLEEVDCCWPALGLIVEVDSLRYHSSRWRRRRDAEKTRRFEVAGWTVWRVPELAITLDPAGTAARLAALAATVGPGLVPVGQQRRPTA